MRKPERLSRPHFSYIDETSPLFSSLLTIPQPFWPTQYFKRKKASVHNIIYPHPIPLLSHSRKSFILANPRRPMKDRSDTRFTSNCESKKHLHTHTHTHTRCRASRLRPREKLSLEFLIVPRVARSLALPRANRPVHCVRVKRRQAGKGRGLGLCKGAAAASASAVYIQRTQEKNEEERKRRLELGVPNDAPTLLCRA